jgi:glyoxalase family protein
MTSSLSATSFLIPKSSVSYWINRFKSNQIQFRRPYERFDEEVITFYDPDRLELELVAHKSAELRRYKCILPYTSPINNTYSSFASWD